MRAGVQGLCGLSAINHVARGQKPQIVIIITVIIVQLLWYCLHAHVYQHLFCAHLMSCHRAQGLSGTRQTTRQALHKEIKRRLKRLRSTCLHHTAVVVKVVINVITRDQSTKARVEALMARGPAPQTPLLPRWCTIQSTQSAEGMAEGPSRYSHRPTRDLT